MGKLFPVKAKAVQIACFAIAALPFSARGQSYLGSIQGEVTDLTGAKVPGAVITVENSETHFKTSATVNGSGAYTLAGLNPGTYTVTIIAQGFQKVAKTNVLLTAGQLQQIDFPLSAGGAVEVIEVSADNSLLDSGSAQIATTLSTQEVTDLPNVGRNPFVLATLAAGVINTGSGGYFQGKSSQFTQPFSGVAVQITSDGSSGHNRLTLDGIPDDPPERLSGASYTGFVPSPEAVQEVKVQTSIFDAQIGHGNGTVTNTVVRGGNNRIHGATYYVFQNTYLNANTYEKVPTQHAVTNPTPRNNDQISQTGFVLDGPVVIPKLYNGKDKTFFMVAFERYESHTAINYSARVPTLAERTGDFSALCSAFNTAGLCTNGIQLYDPLSALDANGNRTVFFPNNNIAARINTTGAALLSYLPVPNLSNVSGITSNNYISTQTSYPSSNPALVARFDQKLGAKNKLNAIYFRNGLAQNFPLQGFPKGIGPGGYGYNVYRRNHGGSIDDVHQFSSNLILDSRFGLVFHPFGLVYPGNTGFGLSSIGIAGTYPYNSFPGTTESDGYSTLAAGAGGQISESTNGSLEEVLTKAIGHHNVRIGFEGNLLRYNVQNPQSGFGTFGFDRRFTQQNSISVGIGSDANSGDPIASELLGYASSASYNINIATALQQIYAAPFLQDDWRVTNKLTLNLGVRYDYESPFTERYNRQIAGFNQTVANPLQASVSGFALPGGLTFTGDGSRFAYPRDLNNIQPRIGGAFEATQSTVLRAGYGIIYFNTLESPITTGFSQTTSYNNYTTSAPLNTLSNPFPNGVVLPTGSSLGLSTAVGQNISFYDPNHVTPKSTQFSASVQQQFPGNIALQIAYIGSRPTQLEVNHNINELPQQYLNQGAAGAAFLTASVANPLAGKVPQAANLNSATIQRYLTLLPFPEFGTVTENGSSIGSAPYNALQIQVNKQMKHHFSFQGNFTWDKVVLRNGFFTGSQASVVAAHLYSVQDGNPTLFGNIFGVLELPQFLHRPSYERLVLGGWQLNSVVRMENGPQVNAPGNVDIIGPVTVANATRYREFNTCYDTAAGTPVNSSANVVGCDARSPVPAFQVRQNFTLQTNSNVLPVREPIHPQIDFSMFKRFVVREGTSFEIRGEFFNVLNTPNFGAPSTSLGSGNTGSACSASGLCSQANDPRVGQLTARLNF